MDNCGVGSSNNKINWFPGHMASALKMMGEELRLCDVVIYLLDARAAVSCLNPKFDELIMRRPVLFVVNKADLAPRSAVRDFECSAVLEEIRAKKGGAVRVVALDSTRSGSTGGVVAAINSLLAEKIETARTKGIKKTLRAMVVGVTNCGKSTFINNLSVKGKTLTGDKPGVTRTKQWVPVNDYLWVLDTPGTLWPAFSDPQVAKNLAYIGSIKDDVVNTTDLSKELIADLIKLEPGCLAKRFAVLEEVEPGAVFKQICIKRGYVLKGGVLDEERAAKALLTEFRAGKIARANLDKLISGV